jgi:alpha-galactosidase
MKTLDTCKYHVSNGVLTLSNALFSHSIQGIDSAVASVKDAGGLSVPYLEVCALSGCEEKTYCIWEDLCAVYMPRFSGGNILTLDGEHWVVSYITLKAFSDRNDTLLEKSELHLYLRSLPQKEGDIFILEDKESGNCIVILSETPDYLRATLEIRYGQVNLENGGNGLMLGFCRAGEGGRLCREYYRRARHCRDLLAMSNTWGDRNGFSRVCRDFVRNEIDAAKELGVGIVQIDDGWQTGNSAEVQRDPLGRRIFDGDFWELDRNKFPDGMEGLTQYARNAGVKVGLWFAPDSHDCYALLDRDIGVLRKAYDEWGIRFFKLDMFWIQNSEERDRFLSLLSAIYSLGNDVAVQIDVTRDDRLNYLCGREYGTVFVENRYTKVGNYFPHRVLRNLWMLGHYIPTSKFQFELVNPNLNVQSYRENDPFAPSLYDMDYLFACVMLSNPLFWMEMQFLSKEHRREIENIFPTWKSLRPFLANADVKPIGNKPSGRSFTGFEISDGSKVKYLLLFREVTDCDHACMMTDTANAEVKVLASNTQAWVRVLDGCTEVRLAKPRAYALIELIYPQADI